MEQDGFFMGQLAKPGRQDGFLMEQDAMLTDLDVKLMNLED